MRNLSVFLAPVLLPLLLASGCGRDLTDSAFVLGLPDLPPAWGELLGAPQWRIEWISPGGARERVVTAGDVEIALPQTWASPVTAWPFWPDKGISPGLFYPAGAIFPFDVSGAALRLSWRGGVDAVLYRELAAAGGERAMAGPAVLSPAENSVRAAAPRQPWNFDWPRFRELLEDPSIPEEVRLDPWRVDWKQAAAGIVSSGFNKRYIRSEAREEIPVPVPPGPWIGASPFVPPLIFGEGEMPVFPVGSKPGSWVSPAGTLRCTAAAWIFMRW
jgi:hypothetical protein